MHVKPLLYCDGSVFNFETSPYSQNLTPRDFYCFPARKQTTVVEQTTTCSRWLRHLDTNLFVTGKNNLISWRNKHISIFMVFRQLRLTPE